MSEKKYALVDGSGYIFRAYYAVAQLSNSKGFPTNALFGFSRMLQRLLNDFGSDYQVVMFFDAGRETFRNELYSEYKANRDACPEDLVPQMPYFRRISEALGLPVLEQKGYEADDLIGTFVERALHDADSEVVIVSGDKDLAQLVSDKVKLFDSMRDRWMGPPEVLEKFGVQPEQIVDYLALVGDSSDNIPGMAGVGAKTAAQLLSEYGNLEKILVSAEELRENKSIRSRKKIADQIESDPELVRLSYKLATIVKDAPAQFSWRGEPYTLSDVDPSELSELFARRSIDLSALSELFTELDFQSLLKEFELTAARQSMPDELEGCEFKLVTSSEFPALLDELKAQSRFAFDLETTSLEPYSAKLCGIALCWNKNEAYYLPFQGGHESDSELITQEQFFDASREIFANEKIGKVGQNLKFDIEMLEAKGLEVRGVAFDTLLAAYLLEPDSSSHSLDSLSLRFLNHEMIGFSEIVAKGEDFSSVELNRATEYAAEDAAAAWYLAETLEPKLDEFELRKVFEAVELPLVEVLAGIELAGIGLDVTGLEQYSAELGDEIERLREEIFKLAGEEFNLNSPKQLGGILFDKLGISTRGVKKTKTGFSTDSSVLERLAVDHELPAHLLRYRALHKLKSTYVDALPAAVNPVTSRLHTKLNQAVTATGRLSSSEPNLQNIPIQNEEGRRVRAAFVAPEGKRIISADYSQVELRLLAHLSADEGLQSAFQQELDIHAATAREIMMIPQEEEVPSESRRLGKTINFGIIYGMSAFRLSRDLGIPVDMAKQYIEGYFARYPKVQEYFDGLEASSEELGYVETLMGRKRFMGAIQSDGRDRGFVRRAALNAPIQGSAADVIKLAMIDLFKLQQSGELPAKLILQVHDELLFEVSEADAEKALALIIDRMQNVVALSVPLKVDARVGKNWDEAH